MIVLPFAESDQVTEVDGKQVPSGGAYRYVGEAATIGAGALLIRKPVIIYRSAAGGKDLHGRQQHCGLDKRTGLIKWCYIWSGCVDELNRVIWPEPRYRVPCIVDVQGEGLSIGQIGRIADREVITLGIAHFVHCPGPRRRLALRQEQ